MLAHTSAIGLFRDCVRIGHQARRHEALGELRWVLDISKVIGFRCRIGEATVCVCETAAQMEPSNLIGMDIRNGVAYIWGLAVTGPGQICVSKQTVDTLLTKTSHGDK